MKKLAVLLLVALSGSVFSSAYALRPLVTNSLIKCADYSSVYYLSDADERWVFPDETTYFTWYMDFNDVIDVSCDELSTYPIGGVVTFQPGTNLLTMPSTDDVYAVEPGGLLRLIASESDAIELYGDLWWTYVRDTSEAFWPSYTVGAPLEAGEVPEGSLLFAYNPDDPSASNSYYFDGSEIRYAEDHIDQAYDDWGIRTFYVDEIDQFEMGDDMDDDSWELIKTLSHRPYTCEADNISYHVGDSYQNICNECSCNDQIGWLCTEMGCE
ncbi:hypothetical protein HN358_01175 [Candidatus Uhrbacteria bacterium]|jgi:hypothetical protein|nr:hypothetical protein [Candidatus Uhrbacteria bacterium]MBT7717356.1 hypothetical protein [Candidatus Uhrbacteria bacterium]